VVGSGEGAGGLVGVLGAMVVLVEATAGVGATQTQQRLRFKLEVGKLPPATDWRLICYIQVITVQAENPQVVQASERGQIPIELVPVQCQYCEAGQIAEWRGDSLQIGCRPESEIRGGSMY